SGLFCKGCSKL
ncbi:hypothetical protein CP082626L3_0017C, partial [Chlamydia psittaci 08-2626_L3]